MANNDFRVLQTYNEIRNQIFNTAYSVLLDDGDPLPPTKAEQDWAENLARQIADKTVSSFDAFEDYDADEFTAGP